MIIRPMNKRAQDALSLTALVIAAPVWVPFIAILILAVAVTEGCAKVARMIDPPGWRRVFALWPVECDPWPEDGFRGWVWWETVWRNPTAPGWTRYRREAAQSSKEQPLIPSEASTAALATDESILSSTVRGEDHG